MPGLCLIISRAAIYLPKPALNNIRPFSTSFRFIYFISSKGWLKNKLLDVPKLNYFFLKDVLNESLHGPFPAVWSLEWKVAILLPKIAKKVAKASFYINRDLFENSLNIDKMFEVLLYDNFLPRIVKNRPICSHWFLASFSFIFGLSKRQYNFYTTNKCEKWPI